MKRVLHLVAVLLILAMTGCANKTIRSDVTVFHDWPSDLQRTSFVFERSQEQDASLEYRNYENLVRGELLRLGFSEAAPSQTPRLKVSLAYRVTGRDVQVVEPVAVDPWYGYPPFYGPYPYGRRAFYWPHYYYDPFWYGPPTIEYRQSTYEIFRREVRIMMSRLEDGKRVYEVTVDSEGETPSLAMVMPYLVRSAFTGFPGKNGETRHIELPLQNQPQQNPAPQNHAPQNHE